MSSTRSIAELRTEGITLRAEEAVAIVQQLIHNAACPSDSRIAPPYGPPTPESVHIDDKGVVTCRTCESTLGVSEVAILLQQLLPAGAPRVPGALRYMVARALHDVDAPPFDSIDDFSAGLARFERGDRSAVVRAMLARANLATSNRPRPVVREDRRQRMPTASDFRRELRAADARIYAQQVALRAAGSALPAPERRRIPTLAAGVAAGLSLIAAGEAIHMRSVRTTEIAPAQQTREAPPVVVVDRKPAEPVVRHGQTAPTPARRKKAVAAARLDKPKPAAPASRLDDPKPADKESLPVSSPTVEPSDTQRTPSKIDRLHLGWLRKLVAIRTDPL